MWQNNRKKSSFGKDKDDDRICQPKGFVGKMQDVGAHTK